MSDAVVVVHRNRFFIFFCIAFCVYSCWIAFPIPLVIRLPFMSRYIFAAGNRSICLCACCVVMFFLASVASSSALLLSFASHDRLLPVWCPFTCIDSKHRSSFCRVSSIWSCTS